MRSSSKTLFVLTLLALTLTGVSPPRAEPPGGADRKNQIGLYLWLPAVDGSMVVDDMLAPIDFPLDKALEDLSIGGPLAYSRTPEPWGALLSTVFFGMDTDFTTPVTGLPGTQSVDFFMVDAVANRRWGFNDNKLGVELLVGLRYWRLEQGLVIDDGPVSENSSSWVDGVLGGRVTVEMAKNWWFMGRLDAAVGGSDGTWNTEVMFQWRASRLFSLAFGYRFITVKYETDEDSGQFGFDVDISGPTMAFMFSF